MKNLVIVNLQTKNKFLREFPQKNWLIFYNWDNCGFCHRIRPVWDKLVRDSKSSLNFAEIEQNELNDTKIQSFLKKNKTSVPHFPFFVKYINKNGKTSNTIIPSLEEFKNQEINHKSKEIKLLKGDTKQEKKRSKKKTRKKSRRKSISGKKFLKQILKK